jgi:uncharacterized OB-fold protein
MEERQSYDKPLPELNSLTRPFWEYCAKHELRMQFCTRCSSWVWYPKAWCPKCGKRETMEWKGLSGRGTVYSFTIIRQVIDNAPSFNKDMPFVIALVELEEGPRMYSNLTGVKPDEVAIGDRVKVYFEDVTNKLALPKFRRLQ